MQVLLMGEREGWMGGMGGMGMLGISEPATADGLVPERLEGFFCKHVGFLCVCMVCCMWRCVFNIDSLFFFDGHAAIAVRGRVHSCSGDAAARGQKKTVCR